MIARAAHHKVGLAQALGTLEGRSGVVSFLFSLWFLLSGSLRVLTPRAWVIFTRDILARSNSWTI